MNKLLLLLSAIALCTPASAQQTVLSDSMALRQFALDHHLNEEEYVKLQQHGHQHDSSTIPFRYINEQNGIPLFVNNPGFEMGDYTAWNCFIGDNIWSSFGPLSGVTAVAAMGTNDPSPLDASQRHSIITPVTGNDSLAGFPTIPPGYGNYTARLGSLSGSYYGQFIEESWIVTAADPTLRVSYAVVIEDGGHNSGEDTYFLYQIIDTTNNDTIVRTQHESGTLPPIYTLANAPQTYYIPWQTDTFDLSAYVGATLTIRFATAGCIWGGHTAYCYVDCDPVAPNTSGIQEQVAAHVNVYPNPSSNGIYNVNVDQHSDVQPVVIDVAGRVINATYTATRSGWIVDLSNAASGSYTLCVPAADGMHRTTLIR